MPRRSPADPAAALAPRRTTLPGGLRVVTEFLPAVHSASVGVWVGVGSRDEGATVAGAAHFLEHLLFKSTPTRSAVDIAQAMDAVGGELNAFTAKEHTCYYAHVLGSDLPLAVDLVADVVLNGRCAADDVEVERDVVLEEIAMRDDDPEDALADMFLAALFGDHPVGRPVIGSAQSVSVMTRAQLQSFHLRRYTPERMVVAAAGNVDHDGLVALVREHFGSRFRAALKNPEFDATLVTRAFSGRYARGLANNFTRLLDHVAPLGYPEVHQMTKPIRAAAVQADDPHGTNLWAGSAHRKTRPGPAADIIASLTPDVCSA